MKKVNQNNLDFEMINLDETAGWNQLEIESALAEQAGIDDVVFQGEITYEEEACETEEYLDDTMEIGVYAEAVAAEESYEEYYEENEEGGYEAEEDYDDAEYEAEEYFENEYYEEVPVVVPKKKSAATSKSSNSKKSSKNAKSSKSSKASKGG